MVDVLYGFDPATLTTDAAGNALAGRTATVYSSYVGGSPFTSTKAVVAATLTAGASSGGLVTSDALGRVGFFATDYDAVLFLDYGDGKRWPVNPTKQSESITRVIGTSIAGKMDKGSVVLSPGDYGAVGNGSTDDTVAWNACVAALPIGGGTIDGAGKTYLVTSVVIGSNTTVQNARFKTKPGAVDYVSPITVGAHNDTALRSNIIIRNVHVNGQRSLQTAIGPVEDGARHGFRLLGRIENLLIEDCSATLCASDGISLYTGTGNSAIRSPLTGAMKHIRLVRSSFTFNRRHGGSGMSVIDLIAEDCDFNDNGLDIAGGLAIDHGSTHANVTGGPAYGNGWDMEEYTVSTYAGDIHFRNCRGLRNARAGLLFYLDSAVKADDVNWHVREKFSVFGGHYDTGIDATAGVFALTFTCAAANKTLGVYFHDVEIGGGVRLDGQVELRGAAAVRHGASRIDTAGTNTGLADNVTGLLVSDDMSSGGKAYSTSASTGVVEGVSVLPPHVDVITATGTWTKPTGARYHRIVAIGGGSGGGSGRRGLAGTIRAGGGGGAGAATTVLECQSADLTGTVTVTIGAGGAGGAAVATDDTSGALGAAGGSTTFGAYLLAAGGGASGGGTATAGAAGAAGFGTTAGNTGGAASASGGTGGAGTTVAGGGGAGGGGAGGGITAANVASAGGAGGPSRSVSTTAISGGVVDTTAPATGTATTVKGVPGPGAGGGAASITTAAQAGASAVGYGSGGGGGGASVNPNNSGAGGNGAPGYCLVITTF